MSSKNTNPQLKETIQIESTIRVNGEIENMTFGIELKGEPVRMAAKLNSHQKNTLHAVVPNVRKEDDAEEEDEDDPPELGQLMATPFKSRIQSSLTFNDKMQEQDCETPKLPDQKFLIDHLREDSETSP